MTASTQDLMVRNNTALRLVEAAPFYSKEGSFWADDSASRVHSLHSLVPSRSAIKPACAQYFLDRFSIENDLICDPWARDGTVALQAALMARRVAAFESDSLGLKITQCKLQPAELTDVALRLQTSSARGPLDLLHYDQYFCPFFHVNTFLELEHLRSAFRKGPGRVERFMEMLVAGVLHGSSASFLSVPMSAHVALAPAEQRLKNRTECVEPEYRAVMPRILRKSAFVTRDSAVSALLRSAPLHTVKHGQSCSLDGVATGSVSMILSSPNLPAEANVSHDGQWLRRWFLGVDRAKSDAVSSADWVHYMNASLVEAARVTRSGGRLVLLFDSSAQEAVAQLRQMVTSELHRFWDAEGVLINKSKAPIVPDAVRPRSSERAGSQIAFLARRR